MSLCIYVYLPLASNKICLTIFLRLTKIIISFNIYFHANKSVDRFICLVFTDFF